MVVPVLFEFNDVDLGGSERNIDSIWTDEWQRVSNSGLLRYNQPKENQNTKIVNEPYKFVFQYLHDRGTKRRARVQFDTVNEPFNDARFHFGKINQSEVLFEIKHRKRSTKATAIVNVSPIEWGHFLLVPNLEGNLMQKITTG